MIANGVAPVNPVIYNGDGTVVGSELWHKKAESQYAVDFMANCGTPVVAVVDGKVVSVPGGGLGSHGMFIESGGYRFWYGHMQSSNVSNGATVKKGDVIGTVGAEGMANGICHLHFAVTTSKTTSAGERDVNTSPDQTLTYKFLSGAHLVKVDATHLQLPALGSTSNVSTVHNNTLPTDVISIVPEKIAFLYDGETVPDPTHWELVWPTHSGNIGGVHGSADVPKDGKLHKIIFINHAGNVVSDLIIDLDLKKGDLINFDYTYSIQKYLDCSVIQNDDEASEVLHWMTEHTLDWLDGHTGAKYDSKTYDKKIEGTGNGQASTQKLKEYFANKGVTDFVRK